MKIISGILKGRKIEVNNKLSIIIVNYKKSIVVENMYKNENTTQRYKEIFKNLGGKWINNEKLIGWIFVGKYKDSLEKSSKFIFDRFEKEDIYLEIKYNYISS